RRSAWFIQADPTVAQATAKPSSHSRWNCITGAMIALLLSSFLFAAADDELARGLFPVSRAVAERGLAPGGLRVATGARLALATAVRMVAGVHGRAADLGALTQPAAATRLAARLVLVLDVTDLA